MKRKLKNIIMIFIILLVSCFIFLTMNYAKNNNSISNNMTNNETPPSMNNDNSNNTNQEEPPEKPDEDNSTTEDNSSSNNSIPDKPNDSFTNDNSNNMETPPDKPDSNNMSINNLDNTSNISIIYYLIFGVTSLIISILIIYLIMSKFNKKNLKETFSNKDKILINILSIIILTSTLTYLNSIILNKYFLTNNTNNTTMNSTNNNVEYSATKEITEDTTITSGEYTSTKEDENALLVTGNITADISNITVTKTGDSDGGDNTSFYGTNSGVLAKAGANLTLKNITVNTNATGANGVFCYGGSATTNNTSSDSTTVTISDSTITTTKDNSGGIMTTGGGTMNASNLTVNTSGTSSAAIRTDRGGGTVTVDGGTYTTTGQGSPSIYSTAKVNVSNAKLISKASEGIVIEGSNSVTIDNVTLTDTNSKLNGKSTTYKNIFLYQSMSGDASSGTATFTAKNSNITTNKGDTFYITNTTASITLENNTFTNNDSTGNFLRIQKDSWGTEGSNGGNVTLTLKNQTISGNIVVDSISTLNMTMKSTSTYTGTINKDNSAKEIKLTLDKNSKIKLTGDSYITELNNADSTNNNIDFNGYKLYVNGVSIN